MDEIYYDPYDYDIDANPYPLWKRMRDEAPLYRNDKYGFWALSRFEDVLEASKDHATYSSARGTVLEMIDKLPDVKPMIFHDRPEHGSLRGLMSRAFSPSRIKALEPMIRKIVVDLLTPLEGLDHFDFLEKFGAKVPMMVISTMLGIPEEDREQIRIWTDQRLHRGEGESELPQERVDAIMQQFYGYLNRYIAERRGAPRDERCYDDPDAFIVTREFDRHVTLGQGIHFCLGAALARLEGKVALEETLKRFPSWEVDWDDCERVHTSTVRGYSKLPIRISQQT